MSIQVPRSPGQAASVESNIDPLTRCLGAFLAIGDRPVAAETLTAGLPLDQGRLTVPLLLRAFERAGYNATIARRSLRELKPYILPAILLLKNGDACILLQQDDREVTIYDPFSEGTARLSVSELQDYYTGEAVLARKVLKFDENLNPVIPAAEGHWFWSALHKLWPTYGLVALAAALINVLAIASPLFMMNVYDRVLPNNATASLWALAVGMVLALLFDLLLRTLRGWLVDATGRRADILLASRIYAHVLAIQMQSKPSTTGSFASHLKEFESVREFFTSNTVATFADMLFFVVFVIVIHQISPPLAYVPLAAAAAIIIVGLAYQLPLRRNAKENTAEMAQRHSLLVETIAALETIKVLRGESYFQRIWEGFVGATARTVERARRLTTSLSNITMTIQQIVSVTIVVVGAYLFKDGDISTGGIIASVMLASRAVAPLGQFAMVMARCQQSFSALGSLNKIMGMPSERPIGKAFLTDPIPSCHIQFQNVSFTYPGASAPALQGFNLTISPGERVGIIGKIGSGKTTIGRLLVKLYEAQEGALLLDGIDIRQFHPHEVRRNIGLHGQDVELFHGTIRSNLLMGNPRASDQQIIEAAMLAGVEEFVRRHPAGFDMPVGERGQLLSGGQRQSVALARLLIAKPRVIFLDEPSSAMDLASERRLIEQLKRAFGSDQTIIVATHRYSMLELIDRLVVVSGGKVAADGPKDKVMELLKQQAQSQRLA